MITAKLLYRLGLDSVICLITLLSITDWILENPDTKNFLVGYFGASTGTVQRQANNNYIFAIVSRSGRPDLAGLDYLSQVKAPTLFVVGGNDSKKVIDLNKMH